MSSIAERRHDSRRPGQVQVREGSLVLVKQVLTETPPMIRLTVLYGHPQDPVAFDRYYREVHIPIAKKMQGLKGWTIGKCQSADPTQSPAYYMIVGLYADSREQMEAILASPEGQATIADVGNFATGGVTFLYDEEEVLIPYQLT